MSNNVTEYSFNEAQETFGIQYQIKQVNKSRFDIILPYFSVTPFLKGSILSNASHEKIFDSEHEAVEEAIRRSNECLEVECNNAKRWLGFLNSYAVTTLGCFFLSKKYRNDRKKTKKYISDVNAKAIQSNGSILYFSEQDIFVDKDVTFTVHNPFNGKAYYLNIGYEHNGRTPKYAEINLSSNGLKLMDGVYYHNYLASSIDGNMDENDKYMMESHGFAYGCDSLYNGFRYKEGVLFTFNDRAKIYPTKDALKKDLNNAIESTIKRLEQFSDIESRL